MLKCPRSLGERPEVGGALPGLRLNVREIGLERNGKLLMEGFKECSVGPY